MTDQAVNVGSFGLPEYRVIAGYKVGVSKNTDLGVQVYWQEDYTESDGGTGRSSVTGLVRLGVKFA